MEPTNQTSLVSIQKELRQKKIQKRRRKVRKWLKRLIFVVLIGLISFGLIQFEQSRYSKLNTIIIKNNRILSDEEILKSAKVEMGNRLYLTFAPLLESNLKQHDMIQDVSIGIDYLKQTMIIDVLENNLIGYIQSDNIQLLSENGELYAIDPSRLDLLADLPQIHGYLPEDLSMLSNYLIKIDPSIYASISEMHRDPVSYDQMQISLTMSQGIVITSPLIGLELLTSDYYYDIINRLSPENRCVLIDPFTKSAVSSPCQADVTNP